MDDKVAVLFVNESLLVHLVKQHIVEKRRCDDLVNDLIAHAFLGILDRLLHNVAGALLLRQLGDAANDMPAEPPTLF